MSASAGFPAPFKRGTDLVAGLLALGVHAVFLTLLVFGVSWQTRHPEPVMVDLWQALPLPATPEPAPEVEPLPPQPEPPPPPLPKAQPAPPPKPVPVEPAPQVKAPPAPKAPDIALEKKKAEAERVQKLKQMQEAEEKALAEAARAEAEQMRLSREKELAEQKKREQSRQLEEEALMQQMMDEELANEARRVQQAKAQAQAAAAAARRQSEVARIVGQYRDMISAKVRGNTRLPEDFQGNPQVRYQVRLLPTGEVQDIRLVQSSGNKAYDEAVLRAIERSSPLPLPDDRDARAEFLPELSFLHRPKEN